MGAALLKDYYQVYDVDNFRFGLGKAFNFGQVSESEESNDDASVSEIDESSTDNDIADSDSNEIADEPTS